MWSATQTDISINPEVGQTQDSSEKRPEVVIRVRKTETKDESNKGSTNIELLEALDALDPYQVREDRDHPVTKCGGRIFRTPVFHSSHDESMSGEGKSNGNHNILSKVGIRDEESGIVGAIAKWVERIQSDRNQENELKWSVLISSHLYADLNLAVKEHVIDYDSLQVFFTGENLPTFILTLYDLTKSSETSTTVERKQDSSDITQIGKGKPDSSETTTTGEGKPVKSLDGKAKSLERNTTEEERPESSETTPSVHTKVEGSARKFALQLAQELTVELHKFCCVDFLLLPCAMTYKAFIDDLLHNETSAVGTALQWQIEQEQRQAQWCYSGPLQLSESGYREVKEATTLVASVSYVPYILNTTGEQSAKNKIWLLKFNPNWCRALSLLIEALGSTDDATYTLTCSEDKYRTVEMIVLEAARRWAFSHDVILRLPTHSDLNLVETKNDLLHLTGKRTHTRYRMQINKDGSAMECRRYRGKSETEHVQKKAEVPTSQGGQHTQTDNEGTLVGSLSGKRGQKPTDSERPLAGSLSGKRGQATKRCCDCTHNSTCQTIRCLCKKNGDSCNDSCNPKCTNKRQEKRATKRCCDCSSNSTCQTKRCHCKKNGVSCNDSCNPKCTNERQEKRGPRLEPDIPQERVAASGSGTVSQQRDDAGPGLSDSEIRKDCSLCSAFESQTTSAVLHLSRRLFENTVNNRNKSEKNKELDTFVRCIAALLNSGGGIAVLHTESSHLFNKFWEIVLERLVRMIPDDSLFSAYFKANLDDDNHVIIKVEGKEGRSLSISAFHTKNRVGTSLRDPTQSQFRKLLRELTEQHSLISEGKKRARKLILGSSGDIVKVGISTDIGAYRECLFQETEEIEARRVPVEQNTPATVFKCIWNSLPFLISAFSKLSAGGSVFYGIAEERLTLSEKTVSENTGKFVYEGVLILDKGQQEQLREQITTSAKTKLLWYPSFPKDDPVDVVFHPVKTENTLRVQHYVVEVAVRHFPGVVFDNKEGPEVYVLRHGEPQRLQYSIDELVEMFQKSA